MESARALKISSDLKGMTVLSTDTGARIGEIFDALVNPESGMMAGIVIRTDENVSRTLDIGNFHIGPDAVMASAAQLRPVEAEFKEGVSAMNLTGVKLVTEDGRLVGSITDVYLVPLTGEVLYRVAGSTFQRFVGGGFYLPGNVPRAFSPDGKRIIVPSDTEERHASSSLDELVQTRSDTTPTHHG